MHEPLHLRVPGVGVSLILLVGALSLSGCDYSGAPTGPEALEISAPVHAPEAHAASKGPGGNSDAAHLCRVEWRTLKTTDGEGFRNVGQCVSYAARGGEFAPPEPELDFRGYCESVGGSIWTELRNGVEVAICIPANELGTDEAAPMADYCDGVLTTEVRNGVTSFVCTPAE
jgi:hypothetical protein